MAARLMVRAVTRTLQTRGLAISLRSLLLFGTSSASAYDNVQSECSVWMFSLFWAFFREKVLTFVLFFLYSFSCFFPIGNLLFYRAPKCSQASVFITRNNFQNHEHVQFKRSEASESGMFDSASHCLTPRHIVWLRVMFRAGRRNEDGRTAKNFLNRKPR